MSKKYFAFLDIVITEIIPQRLQLQIINTYLSKFKSEVSFYSTEAHNSYKSLEILNAKINEKPKIKGLVFYSLLQFCYGENIAITSLKKILKNYECVFLRENLILKSEKDFFKNFISIKSFKDTHDSLIQNLKFNFDKILEK